MLAVRIAARSTKWTERTDLSTGGFVLAGGKSTRFGADKALAELGTRHMIDAVIGALRPVVDRISIVGGDPAIAFARHLSHIEDHEKHRGPWAALASVSAHVSDDMLVFVPCDVPLLRSETLINLREAARLHGVSVARSESMIHWSVSAWTRHRLAEATDAAATQKSSSLYSAIEPLKPDFVVVDERETLNVNTPAELAIAASNLAELSDD